MLKARALTSCLSLLLVVALTGCPKKKPTGDEPAGKPPATKGTPAAKAPAQKAPASQPAAKQEPIRVEDVGLATPESVLHDGEADVYLVSNINGSPHGVDGNGFISKVSPDGKVVALKWIDGAKQGVELNAPKGMALTADTLWVTDIDRVRMFDRASGAPKGTVVIPKSTFINDLVAAEDGTVYTADLSLDKTFKPAGTDAIYKLVADGKQGHGKKSYRAVLLLEGKALGNPNGLALDGGDLAVATFSSGELYRIKDGKQLPGHKAPKGALDGLIRLPEGGFLVSSWAGSAVYRVDAAGAKFELLADKLPAPADIGYDSKRKRVLVPLFKDDALVFLPL